MAQNRVTTQDIADACGLSRGTVSKVLNNRGAVPESTRALVIQKAKELGYYAQLPSESRDTATGGSIAVLSGSNPLNHSFGSMFLKAFTDAVCRSGLTVQIYELSEEEIQQQKLPSQLMVHHISGILGIELFDEAFIRYVCGLGVPTVFVDGYCGANRSLIPCDLVSMENSTSAMLVTEQIIRSGARTLGFVGDISHCNSFYERWEGFCSALAAADLNLDRDNCILAQDGSQYADLDWTVNELRKMPHLPDAFVCANDYHAVKLMRALKTMGLSIPRDIMVSGFDNSPEAEIIEPGLTSVDIPSGEMGVLAANVLLSRRNSPQRSSSLIYMQTKPVFRQSTKAT